MIRTIDAAQIRKAVRELCIQAQVSLRPDVLGALRRALRRETQARPRRMLGAILDNAAIAARRRLAICQDTGLPAVFVELGQDVHIRGDLRRAVIAGIEEGYRRGSFRESIVADPLGRGTPGYAPGILHVELVKGRQVRVTVLPKGFGCENKSRLCMLNPTAGERAVEDAVVEAVRQAGPDACPPYVVGVGIGATADHACLLAKQALLRKIVPAGGRRSGSPAARGRVAVGIRRLEERILQRINRLGLGPMGLGGRCSALAVHVLAHPTHIAGLPVAVSISCHALRSAARRL